ncbi:MAG: hypothetical protein ACX93I_07885 [Winogradskyella sp.]|jgi:hypothetical protein
MFSIKEILIFAYESEYDSAYDLSERRLFSEPKIYTAKGDIESKTKSESSDKITAAGVANTALGTAAIEIAKKIATPEMKKNATKEDIENLATLIKGKRFYPIRNLPKNNSGKSPFYDLQTEKIVYF